MTLIKPSAVALLVLLIPAFAFPQSIDRGGLLVGEKGIRSAPFSRQGHKWGPVNPMFPLAPEPGGVVTFSFVGDGVSMNAEPASASVSLTRIQGFDRCFIDEIRQAFAAWSAVANIQFVEVPDSGLPFDALGATGDIRIGAHVVDGPGGDFGHAFYPPPNGATAAGDIHFDSQEVWSCTPEPGALDIGVVAAHQIGHSIGLAHDFEAPALMGPDYNPPRAAPFVEDIRGASAIYGPSATPGRGHDLVLTFPDLGVWTLSLGYTWTPAHHQVPQRLVSGDLDGNGTGDAIADFGTLGAWALNIFGQGPPASAPFWYNVTFSDVAHMLTAELDGHRDGDAGGDDVIADLPGLGLWRSIYRNPLTFDWRQIHPNSAGLIVAGNFDGAGGEDLVADFPGNGLWIYLNDSQWTPLHALNVNALAAGDFDGNGVADFVADFPGHGLWVYWNGASWSQATTSSARHLVTGDVDGDGRDELVADFGARGIWMGRAGQGWSHMHALGAEGIVVGDLDGSGRDDVVIDFGNQFGVWARLNDSGWIQVHALSPVHMAFAALY
jgi:Matrixin